MEKTESKIEKFSTSQKKIQTIFVLKVLSSNHLQDFKSFVGQ